MDSKAWARPNRPVGNGLIESVIFPDIKRGLFAPAGSGEGRSLPLCRGAGGDWMTGRCGRTWTGREGQVTCGGCLPSAFEFTSAVPVRSFLCCQPPIQAVTFAGPRRCTPPRTAATCCA